jgi:hypothetical protein
MKTSMTKSVAMMAVVLGCGLLLVPSTARADHEGRGRYGRGDHDRSRVHIDFRFGDRGPAPGYCPPTQQRQWVPGHYEACHEQVLVQPGHYDRVWHPPQYAIHCDHYGRHHRVLVSPGHYDQVWHEAEYQTRTVQKWVPGRWVVVETGGHYHRGGGSGVVVSGRVDF